MPTLIGTNPDQVPTNGDLGTMAFQDAEAVTVKTLSVNAKSTSDALRITQTGTGNAFVVEDSTSPDSTPFVIDANGNLIVGNTTQVAGVVSGSLQVQGSGVNGSSTNLQAYSASTGGTLEFDRSRGALGVQSIVSSGDRLGRIFFSGSDGTAFIRAASIDVDVDGTPGTNDMPGRLVFSTTADGESIPTERMRIDSAGNVLVTGGGNLGYGTGSGGTVTQATSKSTAVTLNKPTGRITMNNSALAAGATASFIVNNSLVSAQDTVVVNNSGGGNPDSYSVRARIGAGVFVVSVTNTSASSFSDSPIINFAVIDGSST